MHPYFKGKLIMVTGRQRSVSLLTCFRCENSSISIKVIQIDFIYVFKTHYAMNNV